MEVAVGAVAFEAVTTTIEAGAVAGYAISRPTDPLKGTFTRIGSVPGSDSPDSLARSSHIVCHIKGDLYIHGGLVTTEVLAGPEMHIIKLSNLDGQGPHYRSIPALAKDETDPVPNTRAGHTAVVPAEGPYAGKVVMFGGYEDPVARLPMDESGRIWIFDPETLHWTHLDASGPQFPSARFGHGAVAYKGTLIIHGGCSGSADADIDTDTWQFDLAAQTWTALPSINDNSAPASNAIISTTPPLLATHSDKLYLITGSPDNLSTTLHILDLPSLNSPGQPTNPSDPASPVAPPSWTSFPIPTNPLTPSPGLRSGATNHAISTGLGRTYLLICFGASPASKSDTASDNSDNYASDIWTLQLPTSPTTPAAAKDAARSALPRTRTHALEYHAVSIVAKEEGAPASTWMSSARTTAGAVGSNVGAGLKSGASGVGGWVKGKAAAVAGAGRDVGAAAGVGDVDARAEKVVMEDTTAMGEGPGPVLEDQRLAAVSPVPVSPVVGKERSGASPRNGKADVEESVPAQALQPGTTANAAAGVVEGKAHPGPRAWCGSSVLATPYVGVGVGEGPVRVVLWGGVDARGVREGDGWVVELKV